MLTIDNRQTSGGGGPFYGPKPDYTVNSTIKINEDGCFQVADWAIDLFDVVGGSIVTLVVPAAQAAAARAQTDALTLARLMSAAVVSGWNNRPYALEVTATRPASDDSTIYGVIKNLPLPAAYFRVR